MEIEAQTDTPVYFEVLADVEAPVREDANPKNNWKLIALVSGTCVLVAVLALFMLWPSKDGDQRIPQPGGTSAEPRASTGPLPRQEDDTGSKYKFPSAPPPSPFDADDVNEVEMPSIRPAASSIPMKEKDGSEAEADDDSEEDDNNNDRESIDGNADSKHLYFHVDGEDDPISEGKPLAPVYFNFLIFFSRS